MGAPLAAVAALLVGVRSLCAVPPPTPASKATRRLYRAVLQRRLAMLDELEALPAGCERCSAAQRALVDVGDFVDLEVPVQRDVHNRAMALCVSEPRVVEALFEEVMGAGVATEATYAVLMRSLVEAGELGEAVRVLQRLLATESFLPRVRSCAPLLHALAASGAQRETLDLWRALRRRGVEFTPAEHGALLAMHGRAGAARSAVRRLEGLRDAFPCLEPPTGAAVEEALRQLQVTASPEGAEVRVGRGAIIDARGVCAVSGVQLQLLTLSAEERAAMRAVLLKRAGRRRFELEAFARWLDARPQGYDYVLDGPNIAYYNQNYEGGGFCYMQLAAVVALLRSQAAPRPCPPIHIRHTTSA